MTTTILRELQLVGVQSVSDPVVTDDSTKGYKIGHLWANLTSKNIFLCTDNTATAAVWVNVTANGVLNLTSSEVAQLANIDSNTISNAQWAFLNKINAPTPSTNQILRWNGSQWINSNETAATNYWSRSGTTLSTATAGDNVRVDGDLYGKKFTTSYINNRYILPGAANVDHTLFTVPTDYTHAVVKVLCSFISYIGNNFVLNESCWRINRQVGTVTSTLLTTYFNSVLGSMSWTGIYIAGSSVIYRVSTTALISQSILLNLKVTWLYEQSY